MWQEKIHIMYEPVFLGSEPLVVVIFKDQYSVQKENSEVKKKKIKPFLKIKCSALLQIITKIINQLSQMGQKRPLLQWVH